MSRKYLQHITAFLLSWIMVIHGVLVLTPEQQKVLCVAADHIAIEMPSVWVNTGVAGDVDTSLFFHDYHVSAGDACVDIPLETNTLVASAGFSGHLPVTAAHVFEKIQPVFNTPEDNSSLFLKYPPGLLSYPSERYAVRSRVLLI